MSTNMVNKNYRNKYINRRIFRTGKGYRVKRISHRKITLIKVNIITVEFNCLEASYSKKSKLLRKTIQKQSKTVKTLLYR